MAIDLILAITHHLLVFAIAGILVAELVLVRPGMRRETLKLLGHLDGAYGMLALFVIAVGVGRVFYGLKGWEYYVHYWAFWAKMLAFLAVGLLSIQPTVQILRWRRNAPTTGELAISEAEIARVRIFLRAEALVFLLITIFAAIMARAVGY